MRRPAILARIIAVILLVPIITGLTVISASAEEAEEKTVEVVIRVKWAMEVEPFYRSLNVLVAECTDATGETLIRAGGQVSPHDKKITIFSTGWEKTVSLVPGYYKLSYDSPDYLGVDTLVWGRSEVFEVRAGTEKMYVYIFLQGSAEAPDPEPHEWLIYGEDTRDYWIWGGAYENGLRVMTPEEYEQFKADHPEIIFIENGTVAPEDEKYLTTGPEETTEPEVTGNPEDTNISDTDTDHQSDTLSPSDTSTPGEETTGNDGSENDKKNNGKTVGTIIAWSLVGGLAVTGAVFFIRAKIQKTR